MHPDLLDYPAWLARLDKWGARGLAALLLDAARPFSLLAAQFIYLGEPALRGLVPASRLRTLASFLEDPQASEALVHMLRREH